MNDNQGLIPALLELKQRLDKYDIPVLLGGGMGLYLRQTYMREDRHPYSICWRMGAGEEHIMAWGQWWHSQNFDEEQRIAYFRNWKPPARWLDWMIDAIWEIRPQESGDDFDYSPYFSRIEKLGFGSKEDYEKDLEDPKWLEFEGGGAVDHVTTQVL
jgi:hypothetical protein